jgi:hypothetical protein
MSFCNIGSITRKLNEESEPKSKEESQESQALKLFRKGKNPVDVAITLGLSPSKVEGIYKEFWKLKGLYKLHDLYEVVKHDISLLVNVHDIVKKYDFIKKDIIHIVDFADKYAFLEEEVQELEIQFKNLLKQRHDTNDSLQSAKKELEQVTNQIGRYSEICVQKDKYIENLNGRIKRLETFISQLRNSDEHYVKFELVAREKLDNILKERKYILSSAIAAVIESIKQDHFKEMIINNTITDELNQQKLSVICEALFEKILKELLDESILTSITPIINDDSVTSVTSLPEFESPETQSVLGLE